MTTDEYAQKIVDLVKDAVAAERQACADIASSMDSARGNEQEIARAIRARAE